MLTGKRVLVVEDDNHICEVIGATLEIENMNVEFCHNGKTGLNKAQNTVYDLIILDIMLPGMDGLEICRRLRQDGYLSPIIFLTAKVDEIDKILGLELGADDYITKPFSPRELTARCKASIRRFINSKSYRQKPDLKLADLIIKRNQYQVTANNKDIDFAPREFELLLFLSDNPLQTFTRDQILDQVWGFDAVAETRTVDEHVKRIRQKLNDAKVKSIRIKTIWGVGYQLEVVDNA